MVRNADCKEGSPCSDEPEGEGASVAREAGGVSLRSSPPPTMRLATSGVGVSKQQKQVDRKKSKKSKRKSVASHTGKYADEATARAVLAASVARGDLLQSPSEKHMGTSHLMTGEKDGERRGDDDGVVVFSLSGSQRGKLKKKRDKIGNAKRRKR